MESRIKVSDLQKDHEQFVNKEYRYYPKSSRIQISHCTDGTGKYFRVYRDEEYTNKKSDRMNQIREKIVGIQPDERSCSFYLTEYVNNTLIPYREEYVYGVDLGIALQRMTTKEGLQNVYKKIAEYHPVWIRGSAEVIRNLCMCREKYGMALLEELRYLEIVNDWTGTLNALDMEKSWNVDVRNVYTFSWCGDFAYEAEKGRMTLLPDAGSWEVFDKTDYQELGEGELVITMTNNAPMPLVRLHTGYHGRLSLENGEKCIAVKAPAYHQSFTTEEGIMIPYEAYAKPVEEINETIGNIIWQSQIVRIADGYQIHLYLRPAYKGWTQEIEKLYREKLLAGKTEKWEFIFHETYYTRG